jgi:hypothetical protein
MTLEHGMADVEPGVRLHYGWNGLVLLVSAARAPRRHQPEDADWLGRDGLIVRRVHAEVPRVDYGLTPLGVSPAACLIPLLRPSCRTTDGRSDEPPDAGQITTSVRGS